MTQPNQTYYARIISLRCNPADLDEMLRIYRTTSMPMVASLPGLVSIAGAADTETGQAHSITVWETPEDRERGGINTESAKNLSLYAPLMIGSYVRDAYDVPVYAMERVKHTTTQHLLARFTIQDIEPAHWTEATAGLHAAVSAILSSDMAGYGLMVLLNQAMSRAVLLEFAANPATLTAPQVAIRQYHRAARAAGHFRRPPTSERYNRIDLP